MVDVADGHGRADRDLLYRMVHPASVQATTCLVPRPKAILVLRTVRHPRHLPRPPPLTFAARDRAVRPLHPIAPLADDPLDGEVLPLKVGGRVQQPEDENGGQHRAEEDTQSPPVRNDKLLHGLPIALLGLTERLPARASWRTRGEGDSLVACTPGRCSDEGHGLTDHPSVAWAEPRRQDHRPYLFVFLFGVLLCERDDLLIAVGPRRGGGCARRGGDGVGLHVPAVCRCACTQHRRTPLLPLEDAPRGIRQAPRRGAPRRGGGRQGPASA
mmetsp:Transcript_29491/g.74100  ORF Transcript_29491/g.74100 Transcript_29491/m.74100 type:complete len:271 (+) Transcript_29491:1712-2524(+)